VASSEMRLWWAMVQRDFSERWGALANAGAAVQRGRVAAEQRAEADRALALLTERTGRRRTAVS
jgi:hypothetical protein